MCARAGLAPARHRLRHTLALDGVYVQQPCFEPLGEPTAEEIEQIARWTFERAQRVLRRRGRELDLEGRLHGHDDGEVQLVQDQPVLASCLGASAHDRQLLGDSPGERTSKIRGPVSATHSEQPALGWVGGFNVHAGPPVEGTDRAAVERLCRYVYRPP